MGERGGSVPAGPLFNRLETRGKKAAFARTLGITTQTLNNWRLRGIPYYRLGEVCAELKIPRSRYLHEAGLPPEGSIVLQPGLDGPALLQDFEALPPSFRDFISQNAAELRSLWESIPESIRPLVQAPPKDPERYRAWEESIKALIAGLRKR